MKVEIVPISTLYNLKQFDCGLEELNTYLRRFALPNDKKNIGKTFLAVSNVADNPTVQPLGYYTVSMAQIQFNELPTEYQTGLPGYLIPAMRLGRLATDLKYRNKGLGAVLLKDVFTRAVYLSSKIALNCILVDAMNKEACSFYLKYGFTALTDKPMTLILPLKTIKATYTPD